MPELSINLHIWEKKKKQQTQALGVCFSPSSEAKSFTDVPVQKVVFAQKNPILRNGNPILKNGNFYKK